MGATVAEWPLTRGPREDTRNFVVYNFLNTCQLFTVGEYDLQGRGYQKYPILYTLSLLIVFLFVLSR
jgi:hypothetical protein